MNIDPGVITLIQTKFLQHIGSVFDTVGQYALNLLYLFAIMELVFFGLIWALQQNAGWDRLFIKILKIGLIFLIIQNYSYLVDVIINSFAQIAGITVKNPKISQFIFNPAKIWQYGYDAGLYLLQQAAKINSFGLVLIQTSLGIGILLAFGLLGIQIIVQVTGFYLIGIIALILLPFGAFDPSIRMFDRAVQSVLQAGIRVMVMILIIGIAVTVWSDFDLKAMTEDTVSISQPFGLFFSALLFLGLAMYLPRIAANAVGSFTAGGFFEMRGVSGYRTVAVSTAASAISPVMGELSNVQAATTIETGAAAMTAGSGGIGATANAAALSPSSQVQPLARISGSASVLQSNRKTQEALVKASNLGVNLSSDTLNRLREALTKSE